MYLIIVSLPLLGSAVSGFFGRFIGQRGSAIVTTSFVVMSCLLSIIAFYEYEWLLVYYFPNIIIYVLIIKYQME